jgi:spermidine synthase
VFVVEILAMVWISVIFFLSGLSALVYQLLWMRHLGFIFGNTVYAGATVLTAFMSGLAIGSHLFGRYAERLRNPLKCFAWLEWGVAAYALALPFLFTGLRLAYRLAYLHVSDNLLFLTPLRFVLAFALLLLPTLLMGGTLPVLIRALARDDRHFGSRLGWLYGINTLGAVAGIFACGFWLIPAFGLTLTNGIAAATDLIAGTGAWLLAGRAILSQPSPEPKRPRFRFRDMPAASRTAILTAMLCGFVSLALEVIWFRALILVFGSTTYSFTVMLGVFLLGMSLGSLMIAPLLDRLRGGLLPLLATAVALIGLCTLASLYHFDRGPEFLLRHLLAHDFSWQGMNRARFLISAAHLALPALLFGIAFTAATRLVRRDEHSSSGAVGMVYALNTLGAVAGSFAGGFILLPHLGMERSLLALAMAMALAGLAVLVIAGRRPALRIGAATVAAATALLLLIHPPSWNKAMLASGAFFSPFNFVRDGQITLRETIMNDRLLHYKEALSSTVSVHLGMNEQKYFCVDGKTEADQSPRSMVLQRMIGHLPLLFHPNPRKAVNIGLGAGVSFGALGCHPLDHLEVVEIEPAVREAVRVWGALNHHILENPKAIVTINDGRNHLFSTTNRYDVITADPFEPVMAGAAHLYTADYFRLARARLERGGIMGQYLPLYELSLDDYLSIVRSFVTVFPQSALFFTGFDTILLGFESEMTLDADVLRRHFEIPSVKASLAGIGFTTPEMILGMFVADLGRNPDFAASGILNTDDRPTVEYSAPRSALHYTTDANQTALLHVFTPIPEAWLAGLDEQAAARLQAEHEAVRLMLEGSVLRAQNNMDESYARLLKAHSVAPDNPVVKNELVAMLQGSAAGLRATGQRDEAAKQYQIALKLDPNDFWAMHNLIELGMIAGKTEFAKKVLDRALAAYPESPLILGLEGKFIFSQGRQVEGLERMEKALALHPDCILLSRELQTLSALAGHVAINTRARENTERIERFVQGK